MSTFNPRMLTTARESRGITQKRLAELSGIAQGTISKAESGQFAPSEDQLAAWAHALDYPASIFSAAADDSLPVTFFRKQQALPAMTARVIRAAVALRKIHIERLANSVEMPANNVPSVTLSEESSRTSSDVARELRVAWRVPRGPIHNLTELLEENGVLVVPIDFGSDQVTGISIYSSRSGQPPMMFLSKQAPGDRQRFTCGHELAHMVLHHHLALPPEESEAEADEFAAEFLVPCDELRSQVSGRLSVADLAQLKMHWRVSMQCLLKQALKTGRITASHGTRLFKQLSAMGYRKREPVEVPREQPGLISELVRVHVEDLDYTNEQLSAALHLNVSEFVAEYGKGGAGLRLVRSPPAPSRT